LVTVLALAKQSPVGQSAARQIATSVSTTAGLEQAMNRRDAFDLFFAAGHHDDRALAAQSLETTAGVFSGSIFCFT